MSAGKLLNNQGRLRQSQSIAGVAGNTIVFGDIGKH